MFLDSNLRIGRFTPPAQKLLNLIETDVGRPFSDLKLKFKEDYLLDAARHVLQSLKPYDNELQADTGVYYLLRILPYRTTDNRIEGVVLTFIDITERKQAEQHDRLFAAVMDDSNDAIIVQAPDGRIIGWNKGATLMYGWTEERALTIDKKSIIPEAAREREQAARDKLSRGDRVASFETERVTKDNHLLLVSHTMTRLNDSAGKMFAIASTDRDITEQKRAQDELIQSELNYRELVESTPDAMVIVDASGVITTVNAQTERLFGYGREELLGVSVEILIPERLRIGHVRDRENYAINATPRVMGAGMDLVALGKNGVEIPVEVSLSPQSGARIAATIREISDRLQADAKVHDAMDVAEIANATKTRFLAAASHDLRQPLQSLNMYLPVLSRAKTQSKRDEVTEKMQHSLTTMSELLDALLDISKLQTGAVTPELSDFPLHEMLHQIAIGVAPLAQAKGLVLHANSSEFWVHSDRSLLQRIVENFVLNAVKYTDRDEVRIACKETGHCIRVEVHDSGKGIPADELGSIFEEYYQLENRARVRSRGLGLGLYIARQLARLLDLEIHVASTPGQGSTFSVDVPVRRGCARRAEDGGRRQSTPSARPRSSATTNHVILLIDDEEAVLDAAHMSLVDAGYRVFIARDGDEATGHLKSGVLPEVIVSDYRLPKQTGVGLVVLLREILGKAVPAIILTGDTVSVDEQSLDLSGIKVLRKPVNPGQLVQLIEQLCA